ncbi:hypothetical protein Q0M56_14075, partial [Staphylococcus aureus]|nr:hypothetical protein [Staphylococcus aureus]
GRSHAASALVPGSASTTLRTVGVAENSTRDQAYDGRIRCRRGTYRFENSAAGDAITMLEVGTQCFVVDDMTVAKTNGGST